MARCVNHPGSTSTITINSRHYCQRCETDIAAARAQVDRHVQPKDCFVWYVRANTWQPIQGTGCAHWVAHQLGIRGTGSEQCLDGYLYRVSSLIQRTRPVDLADVRLRDIYISPRSDHTGLVVRITPQPHPRGQLAPPPHILIRHDSSRQGQVGDNDFHTYFHGQGTFRRL